IPTLYETLKSKSDSWESIYQGYRILLRQIHTSAEIISRQIGGVYVNRGFMSDEDQNPYEVVPYETQKESIEILSEFYFDSDKFYIPMDVVNKMQRERRSFDFFGKTEDPKIHNMILKGQKKVLKHFTNSKVLKRLTDSSLYGNKYLPNELFRDLTSSIFNESKSRKLNGVDQNLQNYYLKRLIMIFKSGSFDSPSISASLASLEKIKAYTFSSSHDEATENHKKLVRWKIENLLKN
ncbi:MAG: zinc-dependent metalloprotease, partial [Pseudomonadota bacterium]|nr:zinc-dependent metalloprotease [Pseudomonadota bacterium]